ncbi:TetR/AcrR family transcriptional regulator [Telluria mixta]|nr:TetR/AcrR family transcriptional regulator [Telluria mixta]WEM95734.1 TetR/AcrR family transcriptional regulator [Telluria mixta]
MTKQERMTRADGDTTSRRILDAAGPLFAASGFAETTNKAIAGQAGVDVASINYHFGGRGGLYQAALAEAHRQLIGLGDLEVIDASGLPATEKLARLIDVLLGAAFAGNGWPARLLAREVLSPSSHLSVLMNEEIQPKLVIVRRILSEVSGIAPGDPALLRCMVSVAAPCLMLVVAGSDVPGPAQAIRQMPREVLARHLYAFAIAGLRAVGRQQGGVDAAPM